MAHVVHQLLSFVELGQQLGLGGSPTLAPQNLIHRPLIGKQSLQRGSDPLKINQGVVFIGHHQGLLLPGPLRLRLIGQDLGNGRIRF